MAPVPPARFLTDASLDYLARRLRFLGYDVATLAGARLERLFEAARREGRIVLTLSARHPRRFADVGAVVVPRQDPVASVRALADAFEPSGAPFTRCPRCNLALERRAPAEAAGDAPAEVVRRIPAIHRCPGCRQWFWHGSHVDRVREWLARAVGHEVPAPPSDPARA